VVEFIKLALAAVLKIFGYLEDKQLLDAGANNEKLKNAEAENEARKKTKNIKAANARLDSNTVRDKLRKYKRD
jgi:hypothetical protein